MFRARHPLLFLCCTCSTLICYNVKALQESRSGGCRRKNPKGCGGGKSEHYRAASQLTAGRVRAVPVCARRLVQQRTDQPVADGVFNLCHPQVMGETVRPLSEGLNVRAHQHVWQQAWLGKLLAVQDQIGRRHTGLPAQSRVAIHGYDLRVGRSTHAATYGLDE